MLKKNQVIRYVLALVVTTLAVPTLAESIQDQAEVKTGKIELVIPSMSAQDVGEQVKDALSSWATPASFNARSLPSSLPSHPGQPTTVQKYYNGTPVIEYQCESAYAEVTKRPPPIKNPFLYAAELTQACVYPFEKGVKVYVIFTSIKKTESLTSGLFNGITHAIRGQDSDWMTRQLKDAAAAIKKNLPTMLIARIEVPGTQVQEPDRDAVAGLIPAQNASARTPSHELTVRSASTSTEATPESLAEKVEARKNLTAMGLSYHSQEQFIAAIRRKDDVAVQLFLTGGGINKTARDKNGKTPAEIAKAVGASDIAQMIQSFKAAQVSATPGSVSVTPKTVQPQARNAPAMRAILDVAQQQLPMTDQITVNKLLLEANVPPDQYDTVRWQLLSSYPQLSKMMARVNPETGLMN